MLESQDHHLQVLQNHLEMVLRINLIFVVLDHLNPLLLDQSSYIYFLLTHPAIFLVPDILTQVKSFSNVIAQPIKSFLEYFLFIYVSILQIKIINITITKF